MRFAKLATFALACAACSSGHKVEPDMVAPIIDMTTPTPPDLSPIIDMLPIDYDAGLPSGPNIVPVIVDGQFSGFNVGFISITLCVPGTATCQTIDHVLVDTGSVGLRVPSNSLNGALLAALPNPQIGGANLAECYTYASGYVFGSVRTADLTISGETVAAMPLQIAGDIAGEPPTSCAPGGTQSLNSAMDLGGNAIIGIAPLSPDCGTTCTTAGAQMDPFYFTCTAGTCTEVGVPVAQQVPNPVAQFATDNNGYSINMPAVSDVAGGVNPTGTITFGIGTQSNNALGSQTVYEADEQEGLATLTTKVDATTFEMSVFDSGTSLYTMTLSSLPDCTGMFQGLYCPPTTQTLTAAVTDKNGGTGSFQLKVANAAKLFATLNQSVTAIDDLAADLGPQGGGLFIIGLPSFFGRKLYFGMEGTSTGTHMGPFYAF
jgi:hypothetical protein